MESTTQTVFVLIQQILGISDIHSDTDLAGLVERRLPARSIKALIRSGLSAQEVHRLVVPRRTLAHRVARREALSREESDRAVRVARITALAERTFGDPAAAFRWLRKRKQRFEGRAPLDLLATDAGARLVEEMIYQIDDGMAA
jgi:putative toxin-antitoxin system antitoxin component (TIGR02293 family)